MDNKVIIYVVNEEGVREEAQILAKYKLSNMNNYITYTYGELNDNNMIKIYTTGIVLDGGNYSYKEITSDDEWNEIKDIMKLMAKDENEPLDEKYKSDLKFEGEEVSIRKPKKLLVSKKFADILASKYVDVELGSELINSIPEVNVETAINTPAEFILNQEPVEETQKEDLLNRTIEIPTFEELQARNKNIENVIKNTKVESTLPDLTSLEDINVENNVQKEENNSVDSKSYKDQFKEEVEPLLMSVYEKQMKHIEELEEELSKTKFDLFEKQKEALSLKKEKDELVDQSNVLKQELEGAQEKMNGILSVIQGNNKD